MIEIIAEIGINHNGNIQIAKEMIQQVSKAGANVAKFQLYDPRKRKGIDDHPWKEVVLQSKLTKRLLYEVKEECDRNQIEFMCSVKDVDKVAWAEEVDMKRYKIASQNIYDYELIEAIQATKKPVIVSMGMLDDEIEGYFDTWARLMKIDNIDFLYCVSKYPAIYEDLGDLSDCMKETLYNGFSDHTPGITASVVAMSLGAKIIEKHVTMDNNMDGPDHRFSLSMEELSQLCSMRDDIERILY